jgi:hypothetical protein
MRARGFTGAMPDLGAPTRVSSWALAAPAPVLAVAVAVAAGVVA